MDEKKRDQQSIPTVTDTMRRTAMKESAKARCKTGTTMALAGILLVGLLLRISYLREHVHSPDFSLPQVDAGYYDYWARALVSGDWTIPRNLSDLPDPEIRTKPYFHPPAYPFFLAAIYRLTGGSYLAVRVVQMALGLVNCLLAYLLGRRAFTPRGVGLLFALFMAVYWVFIFFEGELLSPTLLVTQGLLLLYLLIRWTDRPTFVWAGAAGVVFGFYALTRANVLLFGPVVIAWAFWLSRRGDAVRPFLRMAGGFCLGAALTIAPATIRNYIVSGEFVLITTNAGVNLYVGNNETSTGTYSGIPSLHGLRIENEYYPCVIESVERVVGRKMKDSEVASWFVDRAVAYVRAHPWQTLKRMAVKAALFWGPVEVPNNKVLGSEKTSSPTLRYLPGFPIALALAVFGVIGLIAGAVQRTPDPEGQAATPPARGAIEASALIMLFVLATFASYLPFFIAGRFRVPIIPFLLLFGAYGTHELGRAIIAGRYRTAALQVGLLAVLLVGAHIRLVPYEPQPAQRHLLRATCYRLADKIDPAIEECRAATQLDPNSEEGHRRLADLLMLRGDPRQAAVHYQHAARLQPGRFEVQYNLAMALIAMGDHDRAVGHLRLAVQIQPEAAEAHYRLAGLLRRQGQIDASIAAYRQTIERQTDHIRARRDLAALLLSQRRPQEALDQLRWIVDHADANADVHNLAGVAWKLIGDPDEAVASYRRAIAIDPDYHLAHNNIANVLAAQGRSDEAVAHYRRALEIKPDYTQAREGLNDLLRAQGSSDGPSQAEETPQ